MRLINLKPFESLIVPRNQGEVMRGLSKLAQKIGASRFAYVQLPIPFSLVKFKVYPRVLTNFPDAIFKGCIDDRLKYITRAIRHNKPVFFSESTSSCPTPYPQKLHKEVGIVESVIFPIGGFSNAVILYGFDQEIDRSIARTYPDSVPARLAELTHMAIAANPALCPGFLVPGLTQRVRQILILKALGDTNEEVGALLGIKPDTVKKTIRRLSDRLGGISTTELIYHLTKLGML